MLHIHFLLNPTYKKTTLFRVVFCDPAGTRTQDPNIKSVMLYQLSYEIIPFSRSANVQVSVKTANVNPIY